MCDLYDIRSYPTLKYFPVDQENTGKVYTFTETRKIEILEKFALEGGWRKATWKDIP